MTLRRFWHEVRLWSLTFKEPATEAAFTAHIQQGQDVGHLTERGLLVFLFMLGVAGAARLYTNNGSNSNIVNSSLPSAQVRVEGMIPSIPRLHDILRKDLRPEKVSTTPGSLSDSLSLPPNPSLQGRAPKSLSSGMMNESDWDHVSTHALRPMVAAYWSLRTFQVGIAFVLWLLARRVSAQTRKVAARASAVLYVACFVTFMLTPSWEDRTVGTDLTSSQAIWSFFTDFRDFIVFLVFVHHNSGILFAQLITVDLILFALSLLILLAVNEQHVDTKVTVCFAPFVFAFLILSAYVKELYDRMTWYVTKAFLSSEDRSRIMLADMLPKRVLEEFASDRLQLAYHHKNISFLFSDIVGFTSYAKTVEASAVVHLLQKLFARFDRDTTRLGLYKLCTIGDAYVCVSEPATTEAEDADPAPGAEKIWEMSQAMETNIAYVAETIGVSALSMRIGLHFGSCVGGVIGSGRLRYDFWGNDVVIGNQMESSGVPGKVNVSLAFKDFVSNAFPARFVFEPHTTVTVLNQSVPCFLMTEQTQTTRVRRSNRRATSAKGLRGVRLV